MIDRIEEEVQAAQRDVDYYTDRVKKAAVRLLAAQTLRDVHEQALKE
jgi:hypothetical protein